MPPVNRFHHGGIDDHYVYPDEFFDDVDNDHAGTAAVELDFDHDGHRWEHHGTYDVNTDIGARSWLRAISSIASAAFHSHIRDGIAVVHRRR